jgi:hypothetical protein
MSRTVPLRNKPSFSTTKETSGGKSKNTTTPQPQKQQRTTEEKRVWLIKNNHLRSLAEQKEFINLDDKTLEQLLKLDSTAAAAVAASQKRKSKTTATTTGTTTDTATTMDDLHMAIKMACSVVRRVYGYYKSSRSMSKGDYIQFIQQSRVVSRRSEAGLQAADVELLWLKCSRQAAAIKAGTTPCLLPHHFMECISRIGAIKYEQTTPSMVERINRMCLDDLRWNARQSDADTLRSRLVEEDVLLIHAKHHSILKDIFGEFSRKGKMSLRQWHKFHEVFMLETYSKRLSSRHVDVLFHKAQSGSVVAPGTGVDKAPDETVISYEASVLDFVEFLEVIGVMSVYEVPDPYITMGVKLKTYIETVLVPRYGHFQENGIFGVRNYLQRVHSVRNGGGGSGSGGNGEGGDL